jgi:hypothetical protein
MKLLNTKKNYDYLTLIFILLIFFSFFFFFTNYLEPRYYFLTLFTDVENDYYYNAKLLFNNHSVESVYHPGSIIFFISSLIFHITGDELTTAQIFFRYNYIIIIITNLLASIYALKYFFNTKQPSFIFLFFITSIFVWPSYYVYLERLSSDAYMAPVAIFMSIYFFKLVEKEKIGLKNLIILGIWAGLAAAIKITIIPIISLIALYFLIFSDCDYFSFKKLKFNFKKTIIFLSSSLVSFVIFFLPSLNLFNIKKFILLFFKKIITNSDSENISIFLQIYYSIINLNFFLIILFFILMIIISNLFTESKKNQKLIFLSSSFLLLFFYYLKTVELDQYFFNKKNNLVEFYKYRQGMCLIPFLLLSVIKLINSNKVNYKMLELRNIINSLLIFIIILNTSSYFKKRSQDITKNAEHIKKNQEFINKYYSTANLAIWLEQGSPIDYGDASFHNWGNYKYGKQKFNDEVLNKFPKYSMMYPVFKKNRVEYFKFLNNNINYIIIHDHHLIGKFNLSADEFLKILKKTHKIISFQYANNIHVINLQTIK